MDGATLALLAGVAVHLMTLAAIVFKLGQIHSDFKHTVDRVTDHEGRIRELESAPCSAD